SATAVITSRPGTERSPCWSTVRLKAGCCAARMPVRTDATRVSVMALTMISFCSSLNCRSSTLNNFQRSRLDAQSPSEPRDGHLLRAKRTLVDFEVFRRSIFCERDVGNAQIPDGLAAIVDFNRR